MLISTVSHRCERCQQLRIDFIFNAQSQIRIPLAFDYHSSSTRAYQLPLFTHHSLHDPSVMVRKVKRTYCIISFNADGRNGIQRSLGRPQIHNTSPPPNKRNERSKRRRSRLETQGGNKDHALNASGSKPVPLPIAIRLRPSKTRKGILPKAGVRSESGRCRKGHASAGKTCPTAATFL